MRTYRNSTTQGNCTIKECNNLPSLTVPDQSFTVREILEKFANGTLSDVAIQPSYSEDLPDLRGLDISQIHDMKVANDREVKELKEKYENPQ